MGNPDTGFSRNVPPPGRNSIRLCDRKAAGMTGAVPPVSGAAAGAPEFVTGSGSLLPPFPAAWRRELRGLPLRWGFAAEAGPWRGGGVPAAEFGRPRRRPLHSVNACGFLRDALPAFRVPGRAARSEDLGIHEDHRRQKSCPSPRVARGVGLFAAILHQPDRSPC